MKNKHFLLSYSVTLWCWLKNKQISCYPTASPTGTGCEPPPSIFPRTPARLINLALWSCGILVP